jgi:hypothetical protein
MKITRVCIDLQDQIMRNLKKAIFTNVLVIILRLFTIISNYGYIYVEEFHKDPM